MLVGIKKLESQLDSITNAVADRWANECGLLVEARAKELCPKQTEQLMKSINTEFIGKGEVSVGTNLEYAVFVHEGTGIYAQNPSRPKGSYWIYLKEPGNAYYEYKESNPGQSTIYATLEDAKKAKAIIISKYGYEPQNVCITNGQPAQPFLTNALQEQAPVFDEVLDKIIKEAL